MSNLSDLEVKHTNERIAHEAASWIAQLDGNRLSTSDRLALAEWISRSPKHKQQLNKLATFWGGLDQLIDDAILDNNPSSFVELIRAWVSIRPSHFVAVFASFFIAVFSISFYFYQLDNTYSSSKAVVYDVKKGQDLLKTLEDGSVLHLNTNTVVEVLYSKHRRTVRLLRGEVFFDVAKDHSRPFEVFVGESHIVAVGTAFDIRLNGDKVDVIVTEGRIEYGQVTSNDVQNVNVLELKQVTTKPILVDAGHSIQVDIVPTVIKTNQQNLDKQTAWRKGELYFVNSPLAEVVSELSRYNDIDISIQPELRNLKIGGRFLTTDVDRILKALEMSADIKVQRHSDGAIFLASR